MSLNSVSVIADALSKFIQLTVRLGPPVGESYAVLSGLRPGDTVVTEGSFLLRAESTRNAPSGRSERSLALDC